MVFMLAETVRAILAVSALLALIEVITGFAKSLLSQNSSRAFMSITIRESP